MKHQPSLWRNPKTGDIYRLRPASKWIATASPDAWEIASVSAGHILYTGSYTQLARWLDRYAPERIEEAATAT